MIGVSMIVMAALIWLPVRIVGAIGLLMIVLHNLLDVFQVPPNVAFAGQPAPDSFADHLDDPASARRCCRSPAVRVAFVAYPLIPWIGVMAAGYALGTIYGWDPARRRKLLLGLGLAATVLFIGLRASNLYGDPDPFRTRDQFIGRLAADPAPIRNLAIRRFRKALEPKVSEPAFSVLAFLNTQKYPPSLLFLLMTLGSGVDRVWVSWIASDGKAIWQRIAIVFGRVPLFFYLLQFSART